MILFSFHLVFDIKYSTTFNLMIFKILRFSRTAIVVCEVCENSLSLISFHNICVHYNRFKLSRNLPKTA